MTWQKLLKPSTLWEEGEKWFELEDNLTEGKFDFLEYKEEPLPRGTILQRDVSVAMGPETLGTPGDLSRIWVAFTDQETGEIYLARSDKDWNQWEEYLWIIYAPSGSYQPSLTFDQDGWHRMAVTLVPAGEQIPEVWIIQPPYSGDGIRRIGFGQSSRLGRDFYGEVFLFYQNLDKGQISYRKSSDNFNIDYPFNSSEDWELQPRGFRTVTEQILPYHQRYTHLMFYQEGKGALPRYKMTRPIDLVKIKQTKPLYANFGQPSLEWEGVKYVDLLAKAGDLRASFGELALEWEEMRTGMQVLVHSGIQVIYEQTHLLTYTNPTTTSIRESFVWESEGQISNQNVSVNIYTDSAKRPGIALRCTGSGGTENLYAGYYRHASGNLEIGKYVNGTYTQLVAQSMSIQQEKWYSLRMQAEGSSIRLKIWDVEEPEPSNWALQTTDTSISNGYAGLWDFDGSGTSKWSNFSLNGEEANWETSDGSTPDGWSLQFGTASRWTTETESIAVGFDYLVVPNATVQLGDQEAITNQDGMAEFFDLDGNQLYDYAISHPDFEGVSKGTILIPEEEQEFIPVRIYNNPWDGLARARIQPSLGDVSTLWHQVEFEEIKAKASGVHTNMGLQSILWVEVES